MFPAPAPFINIIIPVDVEAIFTDSAQIFLHHVGRLAATVQRVVNIQPPLEFCHLDNPVELPDQGWMEGDDDLLLEQALDPVELPGVVLGLEEEEGGEGVTQEIAERNKTEQQRFHSSLRRSGRLLLSNWSVLTPRSGTLAPTSRLESYN